MGLLGREAELARLTGLLDAAAGQRGGALVLRGEAGVGKSALALAATGHAALRGLKVLRTIQYEAEVDLPYAGLYGLLTSAPGPDSPARTEVMRAVRGTSRSEPYRLAQSVLELLTAEAEPLLVFVEDAQWLDRPSWDVLGYLSRRIEADPVAIVMAMREGPETAARLSGGTIPVLEVAPLEPEAAGRLLERVAPGLAESLRERVLADAGGNPLGIIEFGGAVVRAGALGLPPSSLPLTTRVEQTFLSLVAPLPAPTRTLLLVAALDDGDALEEIVAATALATDADGDPVSPAVAAGLITAADGRLRFRHPLLRSALRQAAAIGERVRIHSALAEVISGDADREVWHRAAAALGPDERLAESLSAAADRVAYLRSALDISAALLERAAELSQDPEMRARRLLTAIDHCLARGDHERCRRLFGLIDDQHLSGVEQARLTWTREGYYGGWTGAARMQIAAESIGEVLDQGHADLALEMLHMLTVRFYWSNPDDQTRQTALAIADRIGADPDNPWLVALLSGVGPIERGRDLAERLARLHTGDHPPYALASYGLACTAVGAYDIASPILTRAVEGLRAQGNLGMMMQALTSLAWAEAHCGEVRQGLVAVTECISHAAEMAQPSWLMTAAVTRGRLLALRGETAEARALADRGEAAFLPAGAHPMLAMVQLTRGVAALAEGRHSEAFAELYRIFDPDDLPYHRYVRLQTLGLLAEAAVHSGQQERLAAVVAELSPIEALGCSPALTGDLAYARAVLAPDDEAEDRFEEALSADLSAWRFLRARLELAYGTWLRRRRRPAESRERLRSAAADFDALGVTPWADRARAELTASGETIRRPDDGRDRLTPQELQIAQLAAQGLSNRDIGERLFISPRTVSTHLYRIYPKLDIASRAELARVLPGG